MRVPLIVVELLNKLDNSVVTIRRRSLILHFGDVFRAEDGVMILAQIEINQRGWRLNLPLDEHI